MYSSRIIFNVLACLGILAAISTTQPASAKSSSTVSYPFKQAWPTALRLLRIDEHYIVVEKDKDAGYIVFEIREKDRTFRGSMELARTKDDEDRDAVRMFVHIRKRPLYVESRLLSRMTAKLREEYGDPVPPKPAPEPKPEEEEKPDPDRTLDPNKGTPPESIGRESKPKN